MKRVIAIDPSLRCTGYAVVEQTGPGKARSLVYGIIKNHAQSLHSSCLLAIDERLSAVIEEFQPDCAAVEGIIYVQSHRTAIVMGAARGAAMVACARRGIPIYEYAPRRVKQAVVGVGSAQKAQVGFMVRALLGLEETPSPDAADALAIALTHIQMAASPLAAVQAREQI